VEGTLTGRSPAKNSKRTFLTSTTGSRCGQANAAAAVMTTQVLFGRQHHLAAAALSISGGTSIAAVAAAPISRSERPLAATSPDSDSTTGYRAAPTVAQHMSELTCNGTVSLWLGGVQGPPTFEWCADKQHYAASTIKLPLVIAAYRLAARGAIELDEKVPVHNSFRSAVAAPPFGINPSEDSDDEVWRRLGEEVALRWLCYRSIVRSSNLATNLVLERVEAEEVAEVLRAGCTASTCLARGIEDYAARDAGLHNLVTAADLARILQRLMGHELAASEICDEIISVLAAQQINDAIPAGLPPGTWVAHKSGWVDGISHDAGIISPPDGEPFILSVCTTADLTEQEGLDLIAGIAAAAWADRKSRT
jgi:beta-lactamase class A